MICRCFCRQRDAHGVDEALQSWLEVSHHQLVALTGLLRQAHLMRCKLRHPALTGLCLPLQLEQASQCWLMASKPCID